jgi:hypothetical protein
LVAFAADIARSRYRCIAIGQLVVDRIGAMLKQV